MKISILLSLTVLASPALASVRSPRVRRTQEDMTLPTGTAGPEAQSTLPTGTAGPEAQGGEGKKGKKGGRMGKKGGLFMNEGYEYLTELVADKECLTEAVFLMPSVCFAVGGYPLSAFYGTTGTAVVACCPISEVDLDDVAENCVEVGPTVDCGALAPMGMSIDLAMDVTWCCHEPTDMDMDMDMPPGDGRRH